jgi:hypothetical protein
MADKGNLPDVHFAPEADVASGSAFDPERSSAAVSGNEVDIDQHLMKWIVDTVNDARSLFDRNNSKG